MTDAAHSRLIDAVAGKYWSLPAKARGDFVVDVVNGYHSTLTARRPDFSPWQRAQLTIEFSRALVAKIDYPSGHPLLRRLLAECAPAGSA
jgi:hypothetical protein